MKYLAVHKLLWFIIVVVFTLFEGILSSYFGYSMCYGTLGFLKIFGMNCITRMPCVIIGEATHTWTAVFGTLLSDGTNIHGNLPDILLP